MRSSNSLFRRNSLSILIRATNKQSRSSFCTDNVDGLSNSRVKIFDRDLKRKQRDRAAWLARSDDSFVNSVADNLLDRLEDCKKSFPTALCLGGSLKAIRHLLHGRGGVEKLFMMDTSTDMVKLCKDAEKDMLDQNVETSFFVGDEEFLPVKESSLDLVVSCLGLHWTNDLPGAMIQSRLALKPDGLFLAAILGGETIKELRIACTVAQMEREGGISPRLSPLAQIRHMHMRKQWLEYMEYKNRKSLKIMLSNQANEIAAMRHTWPKVRDAGNLLTRAGFTLPGVDVDEYTVKYENALQLIEHLRAMGETNALVQRNHILKKETALATAAVYQSMFGAEDGSVPATFQVIFMTGWKEHSSQQKPKSRGSATVSFQDLQKQFGSEN